MEEIPKEHLQVQEDDFNWKNCPFCNGELTQIRKAFFKCINCGQEIIADEGDIKI